MSIQKKQFSKLIGPLNVEIKANGQSKDYGRPVIVHESVPSTFKYRPHEVGQPIGSGTFIDWNPGAITCSIEMEEDGSVVITPSFLIKFTD